MVKTFKNEDLITWATCDRVQVGDRGYFDANIDLMHKNLKEGRAYVSKITDIDPERLRSFKSANSGNYWPVFLPEDKVIEEPKHQPLRACENFREFYKFLITQDKGQTSTALSFINMLKEDEAEEAAARALMGRVLHLRDKESTGKGFICLITYIDLEDKFFKAGDDGWFNLASLTTDYEIKINGKWQRIGMPDND